MVWSPPFSRAPDAADPPPALTAWLETSLGAGWPFGQPKRCETGCRCASGPGAPGGPLFGDVLVSGRAIVFWPWFVSIFDKSVAQKAVLHPESRIAPRKLAHRGHFTDDSFPETLAISGDGCLVLKARTKTARAPRCRRRRRCRRRYRGRLSGSWPRGPRPSAKPRRVSCYRR